MYFNLGARVLFADVRGSRQGHVARVCAPFAFGGCVPVVDTVAATVSLQEGMCCSVFIFTFCLHLVGLCLLFTLWRQLFLNKRVHINILSSN